MRNGKLKLLTLALALVLCLMPMTANAAVYVEDTNGNVEEYDEVPALSLNGNVRVEYCVGLVTTEFGDGQVVYSTDGIVPPYVYINYRPIQTEVGDVIQTLFYYSVDENGNCEDEISYRIDITK